jgi:hypothetical protein
VSDDDHPEADDDAGRVIVSLSVFSSSLVQELSQFLQGPSASPDKFHYRLGTATFDVPAWEPRAEMLHAAINDLLDRLERVPRALLNGPESFVRLFLTLPAGAETIDARTVKRLADVNATIWIDA